MLLKKCIVLNVFIFYDKLNLFHVVIFFKIMSVNIISFFNLINNLFLNIYYTKYNLWIFAQILHHFKCIFLFIKC